MFISAYDFTFARQIHGAVVPYGEAGDCYSLANCPQGKFSINLTGTGLKVADHSSWIGVGNKPSVWLQRIQVVKTRKKLNIIYQNFIRIIR